MTELDRVCLGQDKNDYVRLFGFAPDGSHFELTLTVASLYPSCSGESRWRLANVELIYWNEKSKTKYSYAAEQLLDYDEKRSNSGE